MLNESTLDTDRMRLLPESFKKMYASVIFCRPLNKEGGCVTLPWSANGNIASAIKLLGFDSEAKRYQTEFIVSPNPLTDGYFTLIAVKIMPELNGQQGTALEGFVGNFMMSEWRKMGTEFERLKQKPNGGSKKVGFIFGERNGLFMAASTWIPA